jgi:hypothetical protein
MIILRECAAFAAAMIFAFGGWLMLAGMVTQ